MITRKQHECVKKVPDGFTKASRIVKPLKYRRVAIIIVVRWHADGITMLPTMLTDEIKYIVHFLIVMATWTYKKTVKIFKHIPSVCAMLDTGT